MQLKIDSDHEELTRSRDGPWRSQHFDDFIFYFHLPLWLRGFALSFIMYCFSEYDEYIVLDDNFDQSTLTVRVLDQYDL